MEKYGKGKDWIRKAIDAATVQKADVPPPQPVVCVFDATKIGYELLLVARAPALKANLGWAWIQQETKEAYAGLRAFIEGKGFIMTAVVLDGRTGIPRVFEDIPVQICQFHQLQIVRRKLTLRPETRAGQTLLQIGFRIAKSNEAEFIQLLSVWFAEYESFISERTYITGCNRWHYTHRRVRSAYY